MSACSTSLLPGIPPGCWECPRAGGCPTHSRTAGPRARAPRPFRPRRYAAQRPPADFGLPPVRRYDPSLATRLLPPARVPGAARQGIPRLMVSITIPEGVPRGFSPCESARTSPSSDLRSAQLSGRAAFHGAARGLRHDQVEHVRAAQPFGSREGVRVSRANSCRRRSR
jgi:hypothetical protein